MSDKNAENGVVNWMTYFTKPIARPVSRFIGNGTFY